STPITLSARIAVDEGAAAGRVVFTAGGKTLGTATVKRGKAAITVKRTLAVGRYKVRATFVPAGTRVAGSRSGTEAITVKKAFAAVTAKLSRSRITKSARAKIS